MAPIFLASQEKEPLENFNSIINKDYNFIKRMYYENKPDSMLSRFYANAYISKGKLELNHKELVNGYELMSYLYKNQIGVQYADSIIVMANKFPDENYFAKGHLVKGNQFYLQRNFKKSLDNYLNAYEFATKINDQKLIHSINHVIGLLKSRVGNYDEALKIFRENYKYYSKSYSAQNYDVEPYYMASVFTLSDAYRRINQLDSASFFNNLGYNKSSLSNNLRYKNYFIFNEGINQYSKKNYTATIDSLSIVLPYLVKINDKPNMAYANSFLGKAFYKIGNTSIAIDYLKKVDEIYFLTNDIHPELRDSYEILINHFKVKGDKEKQLEYIEKLLDLDSTLLENYKYLWEKINKSYDTSNLTHEKELIIKSLKKENELSVVLILTLMLLSFVAIIFWIQNSKKKKIYKQRFKELINSDINQRKEIKKNDLTKIETKSIGFSDEIVNNILECLTDFEKSNDFTKSNITISRLAENFNTNSRYLSKVINIYKKKNFNNYINDLRINFAIEKLKKEKQFRNYTIKAISDEIGYGKAESFSKAFYKRTGIYPSFFIKQLNQ
ncbi:helix-turn-helix domain-containing protein [Aquimarina megaterium]|uniref:helix-turn-helix domain-containing protein n=1 Tax=Aquimarina megaterium TaxID=1443666 RepID=UPI0015867C86|nr:helix-turn-helix domain-containing protein [Aquimarina megaterium]